MHDMHRFVTINGIFHHHVSNGAGDEANGWLRRTNQAVAFICTLIRICSINLLNDCWLVDEVHSVNMNTERH